MSNVIEKKIPTILKPSKGVRAILIPSTWRVIAGITDETELLMRLKKTKYGYAIDIYKQNLEVSKWVWVILENK